jgi:hypothetical protein
MSTVSDSDSEMIVHHEDDSMRFVHSLSNDTISAVPPRNGRKELAAFTCLESGSRFGECHRATMLHGCRKKFRESLQAFVASNEDLASSSNLGYGALLNSRHSESRERLLKGSYTVEVKLNGCTAGPPRRTTLDL